MSFDSLSLLLKKLEQDQVPFWDRFQKHIHLLECWQQVVSLNTFEHSRPLHLQKGVLSVATASSAWAHTLSLQRYQLIKKLSLLLDEPLENIRFSSAHWNNAHSKITISTTSKSILICPKCQSSANAFELERWGVCSCCIVQTWSRK